MPTRGGAIAPAGTPVDAGGGGGGGGDGTSARVEDSGPSGPGVTPAAGSTCVVDLTRDAVVLAVVDGGKVLDGEFSWAAS